MSRFPRRKHGDRVGLRLGALLLVASVTGVARAQLPTDEARRLAADSFRQGQTAFERREFAAAAAAFEQAGRLAPHPSAWLNAAEAWERADEPLRAADDCDAALAAPGLEQAHREEAAALV